jgi:hypothetical protein
MCDGILLQRPLSPLKHALSAVLQHLGGILPPHLGYNPGREVVQHDWLWSVGGHPLSWTSWGGKYSQMHIDALHRWVMALGGHVKPSMVGGRAPILPGGKYSQYHSPQAMQSAACTHQIGHRVSLPLTAAAASAVAVALNAGCSSYNRVQC